MASKSGPTSWTKTRLTERIGIEYPIIQGPLGGLLSQRLTAAVSNFGGLGSFGAHGLEPDAIRKVVREIRSLTSKPFAMNLWVSMQDEDAFTSDETAFHRSLASIANHIEEVQGELPKYSPYKPIRFEDQVQALLDEKVPVFSFIFGIPEKGILDDFRRRGTIIIGSATTVDEAITLEQAGVDVIAASGFEAGGHRGSFLRPSEESLVGTISLVPQVVDAVSVPVIAAGGIADGRGIVAALALGASGVQMGTAFLGCEESGSNLHHRKTLLSPAAGHTALTKGFTGRLARGIRNRIVDELNAKDAEILPYPLQRSLMRHLMLPAEKAGRIDLLQLWAGQSAPLSRCENVDQFLATLVADVSETIATLRMDRKPVNRPEDSN